MTAFPTGRRRQFEHESDGVSARGEGYDGRVHEWLFVSAAQYDKVSEPNTSLIPVLILLRTDARVASPAGAAAENCLRDSACIQLNDREHPDAHFRRSASIQRWGLEFETNGLVVTPRMID